MKSEIIGADTSKAEVLNVSPHGFWMEFGGREYFLDFAHFPWFRAATLEQIFAVEVLHGHNFHWAALDVDLDLDRIINPGNYPLVALMRE